MSTSSSKYVQDKRRGKGVTRELVDTVAQRERIDKASRGVVFPPRYATAFESDPCPPGLGDSGFVDMASGYRLLKIRVDKPCRIRLYTTEAKRDADKDRKANVDPVGDHGLVFEAILTDTTLTLDLVPVPHGFCENGDVPYRIDNPDLLNQKTFNVTFEWQQTEG